MLSDIYLMLIFLSSWTRSELLHKNNVIDHPESLEDFYQEYKNRAIMEIHDNTADEFLKKIIKSFD